MRQSEEIHLLIEFSRRLQREKLLPSQLNIEAVVGAFLRLDSKKILEEEERIRKFFEKQEENIENHY